MKKNIIVLGAGISGLSLSWFLKRKYGNRIDIKIIEKSSRVGGWIQTQKMDGFLFEQGPRSCRTRGNGLETLKLIEELHLEDEVIAADPSASKRYLYRDHRLVPLPSGFISLFFSPFFKEIARAAWHDWNTPKGSGEDESIYNFISRRFSPEIAEDFIDPLTTGIYAGDIRNLSILSCFPDLFNWEQTHGGIVRAILSNNKKEEQTLSPFIQSIKKHSIFTLKNGMETLPIELAKQIQADVILNSEVISLNMDKNKMEINLANNSSCEADFIFSTLPASALSKLLMKPSPFATDILQSIPHASIAVVNLGYKENVLDKSGFGYLIPSKEKEEVLGVVWDSCVFPQQQGQKHTCLTVMLGGMHNTEIETFDKQTLLQKALDVLAKQMNIKTPPAAAAVKLACSAIPQFLVGHQRKLNALNREISHQLPFVTVHGNYLGVSVNDCIANSKTISQNCNF